MDSGPLQNLKVLDFTHSIAGPVCTTLLADFGADVIMVEPPGGSSHRHFVDESVFPNFGRNKRSVVLDLKNGQSTEVIYELAKSIDVVVHNFRPGKMEQLGCGYDSLREHNEELVFCSITGYGESGPYKNRPAFDPIAQALSGLMSITGESDQKPSRVGGSTIDVGTGIYAAFATMLGLWKREFQGAGSKIEVSLLDTAATIMAYWYTYADRKGSAPSRNGSRYPPYSPYGLFETADGLVYLAVPTEKHWKRLCSVIGKEDWIDDSRFRTNKERLENRDILVAALENEFKKYTAEEIIELLNNSVPIAKLQTVLEATDDAQLRDRGTVTKLENRDGEEVTAVGRTIKFSDDNLSKFTSPPQLGQHTEEVLTDLGFTKEQIKNLQYTNAIN